MNTTKRIFMIVLISFCYSFCYAQQLDISPTQWLEYQKESIKSTAYIFEGTVTQQTTKDRTILTCSVIHITKIYRGSPQLKLGSIKVITEQGTRTQKIEDAGPGLGRGRYVIFGSLASSGSFSSIITDNSITLSMQDAIAFYSKSYKYGKLISSDQPAAKWGQTSYKTVDELYNFLKENGLEVQEEVQPAVPRDSVKH